MELADQEPNPNSAAYQKRLAKPCLLFSQAMNNRLLWMLEG